MTNILKYAQVHNGKLKDYSDITYGHNYLRALKTGDFKKHNIIVQLSLDDA